MYILVDSKIPRDTLIDAVQTILKHSTDKKRNFTESVELQISLKNYDPQKDKRFSGTVKYAPPTITWTDASSSYHMIRPIKCVFSVASRPIYLKIYLRYKMITWFLSYGWLMFEVINT